MKSGWPNSRKTSYSDKNTIIALSSSGENLFITELSPFHFDLLIGTQSENFKYFEILSIKRCVAKNVSQIIII